MVLALIVLAVCLVGGAAQARSAARPLGVRPPPGIPPPPKGPQTTCTMTGPAWVAYGVHAPNGPPRRGNRYLVHAWGISCGHAEQLLRAFFPKIPAHPMGKLTGGPKGYTCKGGDPKGTVTKSRTHDGSCLRMDPATTFDGGPTGGKVG